MHYEKQKCRFQAMTLVEMLLALTIVVIIFAAVVPQFRVIMNSWDSKKGLADTIQNGRILMEHIHRNLSKAVAITRVSSSTQDRGYIEYETVDGETYRYELNNTTVRYGTRRRPRNFATPINSLTFRCYDPCDLDSPLTPVSDPDIVRVVEVIAEVPNGADLGDDRTFTTKVYLRSNNNANYSIFGNDTIERRNLQQGDTQIAGQFTLTEEAPISKMVARVRGSASHMLRFAIYSDVAGEPGTLLVQSNVDTFGSRRFQWHETSIPTTVLSPGTYWLAVAMSESNNRARWSNNGFGQTRLKSNDAITNGFLATWGTSDTTSTRRLSIYAQYELNSDIHP